MEEKMQKNLHFQKNMIYPQQDDNDKKRLQEINPFILR